VPTAPGAGFKLGLGEAPPPLPPAPTATEIAPTAAHKEVVETNGLAVHAGAIAGFFDSLNPPAPPPPPP
jgi:hypothetical protein